MLIEFGHAETTRSQRFSHYFTLLYCALALLIGVNLRDSSLYAVTVFTNREVGVTAYYPTNWLFSTPDGVVLEVQDSQRLGYKTTIRIQVLPFADEMSPRNVIDTLALGRRTSLPFYKILSISDRPLQTDDITTVVEYTYVADLDDPFLQLVPSVVVGEDVVIVRRNQVILVSFVADADAYQQDYEVFQRFLETLDY